jgi:hypothetical protein
LKECERRARKASSSFAFWRMSEMKQFWFNLPAEIRALAWFILLFGSFACFVFVPFLIGYKAAFEIMKYILGFLLVTMLIGIWGVIRDQIKEDDDLRARTQKIREPWEM